MTERSPKSWVTSFTYGVSPQPAQAPENSNSGSKSWTPFTSSDTRARAGSGRSMKYWKLARSAVRSGAWGESSSDLWRGLALSLAGQISTQTPQPVQSSGATWTVYAWPFQSVPFHGTDLNVGGLAPFANFGS